jgi:hypothetical protein
MMVVEAKPAGVAEAMSATAVITMTITAIKRKFIIHCRLSPSELTPKGAAGKSRRHLFNQNDFFF